MASNNDQPMMSPPTLRGKFAERFAYYLVGIAIGLVMVGLLMRARQRSMGPPPAQTPATETTASPDTDINNASRREDSE